MEHEATLRFVTNLDRAGIEKLLAGVAAKSAERGMANVTALLGGAPGKSRAELEKLIVECIGLLSKDSGNNGLIDQLEMVQINLPNLG